MKERKLSDEKKLLLVILFLIIVILSISIFVASVASKPDGTLQGSVVDIHNGEAIAGVEVSATDRSGKSYSSRSNTDVTRRNGSFSLSLPPGEYTLNFHASGYQDYESQTLFPVTSDETYVIGSAITLTPENLSADNADAQTTKEQTTTTTTEPPTTTTTERTTTTTTEPPTTTTTEWTTTTTTQPPTTTTTERTTTTTTQPPTTTTTERTTTTTTQYSLFSVDSWQNEDYSANLHPEKYLSYYSNTAEFNFSYPPHLYYSAQSDFDSYETRLGRNIETHTFRGSEGGSLTVSLFDRLDNLNLRAAKDNIYAKEAADITVKRNTLLDEDKDGFSRFVVTGFNNRGLIIYEIVKVTPRKVMKMRIESPPFRTDEEKLEICYVHECISRYCGFANHDLGSPRSYTEYLKSDKK